MQELSGGGESFCSQHSSVVHFGLADQADMDSVTVEWPSGTVDVYNLTEVDQRHLLVEGGDIVDQVNDPNHPLYQARVSPNPSSDQFELTFSSSLTHDFELSVLDITGKVIWQTQLAEGSNEYTIPAADWAEGTYFLRIADQQEVRTIKLMKLAR